MQEGLALYTRSSASLLGTNLGPAELGSSSSASPQLCPSPQAPLPRATQTHRNSSGLRQQAPRHLFGRRATQTQPYEPADVSLNPTKTAARQQHGHQETLDASCSAPLLKQKETLKTEHM